MWYHTSGDTGKFLISVRGTATSLQYNCERKGNIWNATFQQYSPLHRLYILYIMFPHWLIFQDECRHASEDTNRQDMNASNLSLIIQGFTSASSESLTLSLLIDCVSGMWFCNTCTLGCFLGLSCHFQFFAILPPKKREALHPFNSSPVSGFSQVNWDIYTSASVRLSSRKSHL